jgi:hypothetical protein
VLGVSALFAIIEKVAPVAPVGNIVADKAVETSQIAMDAISTILAFSSYTLGLLGLFIAGIALFGYILIKQAATNEAAKIADAKLDVYIKSEDFKKILLERIDRSVESRWQNTIVLKSLQEDPRRPDDPNAFPEEVQK